MTYRPKYPDSPFRHVAEFVDPETDKTFREMNAELEHNIPLGTLVEVQFDEWFGDGACWKVHARLYVVAHQRDCDMTPLYSLSRWNDYDFAMTVGQCHHGYAENKLRIVPVTVDLIRGENALKWGEHEKGGVDVSTTKG